MTLCSLILQMMYDASLALARMKDKNTNDNGETSFVSSCYIAWLSEIQSQIFQQRKNRFRLLGLQFPKEGALYVVLVSISTVAIQYGREWLEMRIQPFIKSMINLWSTDFINFINGRAKGPLWQSSGVDKRLRSNICGFTNYQGKHFEDGAIMLEVGLSWNVSREGENLALIPIQRRATLECNRIGTI